MVQKSLKIVFVSYLVTPPYIGNPVWLDRKSYCVWFIFKLLPFRHNTAAYKDKNQNRCVIGYMKVQKLSIFTYFLVIFSPIFSLLVTMATGNKLRERNMDLLFWGDYECTLKISAKSETNPLYSMFGAYREWLLILTYISKRESVFASSWGFLYAKFRENKTLAKISEFTVFCCSSNTYS